MPNVIRLMKQFSLKSLLLVCSLVAAACALLVLYRVNSKLNDEVTSLSSQNTDLEEKLEQQSRGASLLLALVSEPQRYRSLTDFLATIDASQLRCEITELEYYPLVLYIYRTSYCLPDDSYRSVFDRKSGLVLVDARTNAVIDFKFGTGYHTYGVSSVEPHYEGSWEHKDGTMEKYRILRSGFKNSNSKIRSVDTLNQNSG